MEGEPLVLEEPGADNITWKSPGPSKAVDVTKLNHDDIEALKQRAGRTCLTKRETAVMLLFLKHGFGWWC